MRNVPIPEALKRFPLYHGFPVHFTVLVDKKTGVPDFRSMNETRRVECFRKNWCHLSGETIHEEEAIQASTLPRQWIRLLCSGDRPAEAQETQQVHLHLLSSPSCNRGGAYPRV